MIESVPIYFETLQVGEVRIAENGILSFSYSKKWLATRGAFPLSVTLPLNKASHPHDRIMPWLANLLPEEQQLRSLSHSLGLDQSDALALLREIGGDTAGAISVGTPSQTNEWSYTPLTEFYGTSDQSNALERHFDDLTSRPFLAGEDGVRVSLAGGQEKSVLAVLDKTGTPVLRLPKPDDILAIPKNGAPSTIIVKPDNNRLSGIVENEVYCLHLATAIGIVTAHTSILKAANRRAICALRYDRQMSSAGRIQRIHQEDFAQANNVPPGRKYERSTGGGPTLTDILKTGPLARPNDTLALLDQVIFNILVANTDAHAKNYSLLLPLNDGPRMAPLYDVSCVLGWDHVVQYFAQNLAGKKRKPGDIKAHHWSAIAKASGFRAADVQARVRELTDAMVAHRPGVSSTVTAMAGQSARYVEQTAELVENNALRILGRL